MKPSEADQIKTSILIGSKDASNMKRYFQRDGTVAKWWNPEGMKPHKNPLFPLLPLYRKEKKDVLEICASTDGPILEVGCGDGRISSLLAKHRIDPLVGVDISREMLRKYVDKEGISALQLIHCDAENLPFKEDSFDGVICIQTLVHLPNAEMVIDESARILREGGKLILDINTPNSQRVLTILSLARSISGRLESILKLIRLQLPITILRNKLGPAILRNTRVVTLILERYGFKVRLHATYGGATTGFALFVATNKRQSPTENTLYP